MATQFSEMIRTLRALMWARTNCYSPLHPMLMQFSNGLGRLASRFAALFIAAATSRPAAAPRSRPAPSSTTASARPASPFPRRFGWLLAIYQHEAALYTRHMQDLLADPEMQVLIAADPRFGRVLRPLCHCLGVPLPPALRPPPRRRVRPKAPDPTPEPPPEPPPSHDAALPVGPLRIKTRPYSVEEIRKLCGLRPHRPRSLSALRPKPA